MAGKLVPSEAAVQPFCTVSCINTGYATCRNLTTSSILIHLLTVATVIENDTALYCPENLLSVIYLLLFPDCPAELVLHW